HNLINHIVFPLFHDSLLSPILGLSRTKPVAVLPRLPKAIPNRPTFQIALFRSFAHLCRALSLPPILQPSASRTRYAGECSSDMRREYVKQLAWRSTNGRQDRKSCSGRQFFPA